MVQALLISFFLLMFFGVPVGFAVMGSSFVYFVVGAITGEGPSIMMAAQKIMTGIDSFPLMAIPFFVVAGEFMSSGGITKKLMDAARALVGHLRGGIAQVVILASTMFAAMSGSSIACASIFGKMMIPEMEKDGYDRGFGSAVVACASTVGPIIPPSISIIVYAVIAGCSAGQLLISGVVPGIIMSVGMMVAAYLISIKQKYPTRDKLNSDERRKAIINAIIPMMMPVIMIGGIATGWFTATEAAVVSVVYATIIGIIGRSLQFKDFINIGFNAFLGVGRTMFIIAACNLFGWILTFEGVNKIIESFLLGITSNPLGIMILINIVVLILGMFMESGSIIIMCTPIFAPIVKSLGIDPIHFGIMFVINTMIGGVTPPVGLLMYITNDLSGSTMAEYIKFAWPFFLSLIVTLVLVMLFPPIATWLPGLLFS